MFYLRLSFQSTQVLLEGDGISVEAAGCGAHACIHVRTEEDALRRPSLRGKASVPSWEPSVAGTVVPSLCLATRNVMNDPIWQ